MKQTTALFSLTLACVLVASTARGRPAEPVKSMAQARAAWLDGKQLFDQGRFGAAKASFERGYQLSGKGGFLFNMAECDRLTGKNREARRLYLKYLSNHPEGRHKERALHRCLRLQAGPCELRLTRSAPKEREEPESTPESRGSAPLTRGLSPEDPSARQPLVRGPAQRSSSRPPPAKRSTAFYKHWGFWAGVGAVVVAGSVTAIVLGTRSDDEPAMPAGDFTVDLRGGR
jgi:hypothetical protein